MVAISEHTIKVLDCVRDADRWITTREIAELSGVAPRTARAAAAKLAEAGLFERVGLFPGFRYRVFGKPGGDARAVLDRIEMARRTLDCMSASIQPAAI
jgi:predicted transcriptional regulator of viral defense system